MHFICRFFAPFCANRCRPNTPHPSGLSGVVRRSLPLVKVVYLLPSLPRLQCSQEGRQGECTPLQPPPPSPRSPPPPGCLLQRKGGPIDCKEGREGEVRCLFGYATLLNHHLKMYRVTAINVSRIWIDWAEWAALRCTANSPFPGHVYCHHPVLHF